MIYHIRKRLRARGGNQWYRDNSARVSETFCGAPCTDKDSDWRSRGETWTGDDGNTREACTVCLEVRSLT